MWEMGPSALAALSIAIAVPWIFVAPFAGVLVDRWPKKRVLIGSDLVRAALVAGLIVAPSLPVLLVLVFLKTSVATFFAPADAGDDPDASSRRPSCTRRTRCRSS